ncbi:MAG TPA: galactokinase [Opitutaceae bacterium]|jgi:galactokinase
MVSLQEKFAKVFGRPPAIMTRAPGRIEFIGNHTDYNGGMVLGAAIDRAVWVGVAARTDGLRRFATGRNPDIVERAATDLARAEGAESWINYPLGMLAAFAKSGVPAPPGFDYLAVSDLPVGAGLSSSAAIELASGLAFSEMTGAKLDRERLVKLGRMAENEFVGVPCGILDQGVSGFGRQGQLVLIDCRGPKFDTVPMPAGVHFWIFNTHTKHALVDGLYSARHAECMGAARALGVAHLADVSEAGLMQNAAKLTEPQRKRSLHVVSEISRVGKTILALGSDDVAAVGRLLTASHRSSQTLFENSTPELDFLVDTLTAIPSVYGARLTGGGFGGAAMALTSDAFGEREAKQVADAYRARFGAEIDVLHALTANGAEVVSR